MNSSKRAEKLLWTKSRNKRKRRKFVLPRYNNVNGESFRVSIVSGGGLVSKPGEHQRQRLLFDFITVT